MVLAQKWLPINHVVWERYSVHKVIWLTYQCSLVAAKIRLSTCMYLQSSANLSLISIKQWERELKLLCTASMYVHTMSSPIITDDETKAVRVHRIHRQSLWCIEYRWWGGLLKCAVSFKWLEYLLYCTSPVWYRHAIWNVLESDHVRLSSGWERPTDSEMLNP